MLFCSPIKVVFALASAAAVLSVAQAENHTAPGEVLDCAASTIALRDQESVRNATAAAIDGTLELKNPLTCGTGGDTLTCEYDFGDAESNFANVCEEVGGQLVDTTFEIQCEIEGSLQKITYVFNSVPECLGSECDTTKVYDDLQITINALANKMEGIDGLKDCGATITESSGPSFMAGSALLGSTLASAVFLL